MHEAMQLARSVSESPETTVSLNEIWFIHLKLTMTRHSQREQGISDASVADTFLISLIVHDRRRGLESFPAVNTPLHLIYSAIISLMTLPPTRSATIIKPFSPSSPPSHVRQLRVCDVLDGANGRKRCRKISYLCACPSPCVCLCRLSRPSTLPQGAIRFFYVGQSATIAPRTLLCFCGGPP